MAKALKDFRVIVNLAGWHPIRGGRPFQGGQIIDGTRVNGVILDALKTRRMFTLGDREMDICRLLEGKVEDLEKAMGEPQEQKPFVKKPEPPAEPKKGDPGLVVNKIEGDEKPGVSVKNLEVKDGVKTATSTAKTADDREAEKKEAKKAEKKAEKKETEKTDK